jgi:hypothetical protein
MYTNGETGASLHELKKVGNGRVLEKAPNNLHLKKLTHT